ncbi:DUF3006 domain-containing protein [uncultured Methanomethylovorans sp.]|uniref:DUF3006 domain-containing protein n=1 Tax=uncultured Methanomethylovorans sp. TaxID=183759 RepID=UPI002AA79425|nr:DUF3006 domain-containing protein [uncultured Methanomethylovorans sp.]
MTFKATLDRIENNIAVLLVRPEETIRLNVPLSLLPEGSKEGAILRINITKDEQETKVTKEQVSSMLEKLKNKK